MNISEIAPAIRAGLAFWRTALTRLWGALALVTLVSLAGVAETAAGVGWEWRLVTSLVEIAATVVAFGALFRLAVAGDGVSDRPGPAGLQWTRVEWRIAGAFALTFFLILLIALAVVFLILLLIAVLYVGFGSGATPAKGFMGSPAGQATLWFGGAGGIVLLWVLARLSLSIPATVHRGAVQVFSTWPLTRGRALLLVIVAVLLGIPIFLRLGLPMLIPNTVAASVDNADGSATLSTGLRVFASLLGGVFQLPVLAGTLALIYRSAADSESDLA